MSRMFNLFFFWGYPDTPFIKVPGSNSDVFRPHWSRWFNRARIVQYVSPWSSLCDIDLCWINAPWNQRCPTVEKTKIKRSNVSSFGRARTHFGGTDNDWWCFFLVFQVTKLWVMNCWWMLVVFWINIPHVTNYPQAWQATNLHTHFQLKSAEITLKVN